MAKLSRDYLAKAAPVEPLIQAGRMTARITCTQCGGKDEWIMAHRNPPPDILGKHFATKGWAVNRKPVCPGCRERSRPAPTVIESAFDKALSRIPTHQKEPTPMSNVSPLPTVTPPTDAAKAARRKANELLMFQFLVEKGAYEAGWSDERVAKESGMPLAWVTKRRDEEYGPLKEPGEFVQLRTEIATVSATLAALQEKLTDMARRNGWQT